jgi:hypothetical protein
VVRSVEGLVRLGDEALADAEHGARVCRVRQLVHLPINGAIGEVAVVAPDLLDRRVGKELSELVAHPGDVLDEAADGRLGVRQRFEIVPAAHGRMLERLDLGFD